MLGPNRTVLCYSSMIVLHFTNFFFPNSQIINLDGMCFQFYRKKRAIAKP